MQSLWFYPLALTELRSLALTSIISISTGKLSTHTGYCSVSELDACVTLPFGNYQFIATRFSEKNYPDLYYAKAFFGHEAAWSQIPLSIEPSIVYELFAQKVPLYLRKEILPQLKLP